MLSQENQALIIERYLDDAIADQEMLTQQVDEINLATLATIEDIFTRDLKEDHRLLPRASRALKATDGTLIPAWPLVSDWLMVPRGLALEDRRNRTVHFRPPETLQRAKEVNAAVNAIHANTR